VPQLREMSTEGMRNITLIFEIQNCIKILNHYSLIDIHDSRSSCGDLFMLQNDELWMMER